MMILYIVVREYEEDVMHTRAACRRSLGDIYRISKQYYPNVTLIEVLQALIKMLDKGDIGGSRCNQIKKYVFHTDSRTIKLDDWVEYTLDWRFKDIYEYIKSI